MQSALCWCIPFSQRLLTAISCGLMNTKELSKDLLTLWGLPFSAV